MKNNVLTISNTIDRKINPDMIGLFFEDINFAADGGLYAEMLENRSFEAVRSKGSPRDYVLREDSLYAWNVVAGKEDNLEISINMPINNKNPHYLRFTAENKGEGFANKAYDGIVLKKGMKYKVSFYARVVNYPEGNIEIAVTKDGKKITSTEVELAEEGRAPVDGYTAMMGNCEDKKWNRYECVLTSEADVKQAVFEVRFSEVGSVEFDLFSMIPENAVAGVFRKDLFEALKGLNPAFLRFPGGCIVEGTSLLRRYYWKDTVGELKDRKVNTNLWGLMGGNTMRGREIPDSHYMQSYGIGFYEYFLLCELLSTENRVCKPLPVLNIGVACQFRSYETVPVDSDEFKEYVQDALDLIEFANGPADSKWGSLRAKMGHPASFNMELLAIGNEQWESKQVDLAPRYEAFEKAIHEVYPEIKCLGTAGPFIANDTYKEAWKYYRETAKKNPDFSYAVDEHYYVAPNWLYENVDLYDDYDRSVNVFAGEYAAHDVNLSNSLEAALAEAAMLTGMERNGDIIKLASYAPLFNRIGHSHWTPDMIWFDEDAVVLTPTYYVQKMFSDYSGTVGLVLNNQHKELRKNKIYISMIKDKEGKTIIKAVNADTEDQKLELNDENGESFEGCSAEVVLLNAKSGKAKEVVPTEGVTVGDDKSIPVEKMTNREMCMYRFPEEVSYTVDKAILGEDILLPAKSMTVIKLS